MVDKCMLRILNGMKWIDMKHENGRKLTVVHAGGANVVSWEPGIDVGRESDGVMMGCVEFVGNHPQTNNDERVTGKKDIEYVGDCLKLPVIRHYCICASPVKCCAFTAGP